MFNYNRLFHLLITTQCKFQALFCGRYSAKILNFEMSFKTQYLASFHFVLKKAEYSEQNQNIFLTIIEIKLNSFLFIFRNDNAKNH